MAVSAQNPASPANSGNGEGGAAILPNLTDTSEMQGATPVPVKKGRPSRDLREEMADFVKKGARTPPKQEARQEHEDDQGGDGSDDQDGAEHEDSPEPRENEEDPDDEQLTEDDDEQDDAGEGEQEPTKEKLSRMARVRQRYEAQIGDLQQKHSSAMGERDRAVYLGHVWKSRAENAEKRLQALAQRAQRANVSITDPRDQQIALLQQKMSEFELQTQFGQMQQQRQQQHVERQQINQLKERVTSEALSLQTKFSVPAAEILQAYASYREIPGNENLEMAQVARGLAALKAQQGGITRQRQVNRRAPPPVRPGSSNGMRFAPTTEGMSQFLESIGKPVGGKKRNRG